MPKRVLCGYGIDVDAVSGWINTRDGSAANPTDISRGVFGATVGIDRLLKLWDKYNIKTTWFAPAHSVESFPAQIKKIIDKGHEIGLHGYTHEFVSTLSETQQRDVLRKSIEVVEKATGKKPRGWTAPAWATSKETIALLEEFGLEYDHSFMHHDSQPYYVPSPHLSTHTTTDVSKPAEHWMTPMSTLQASSIVEIPANWHLDDWPPFQLSLTQASTHGYVDTATIERLWKEQFEYLYRECPEDGSFVFPISIHPQVSGKPQVILLHERFIEWINTHEGVEWVTMEYMVDEFKAGRLAGVTVEGGAEV
ncbi:carbohydrate esterase family 4 protein [Melanomma pulvis-pyrius CBS 109.77]|uniref:Carbohydrate esterase family 4 protein n=1 Tax=Melanomma pulvis-pyrius CBS 109.77 TaxID=1314802 RepID=A0A6A6WQD6_9PLEO|nr:carbohydrate esterase family 4 protein [Melanomma pulvis-pyrius CBS 109.77]